MTTIEYENDLLFQNADNEWIIGLALEGTGWRYTASRNGVLWASGWVRCNDEDAARRAAWSYGLQATVLP